MSGTNIEVRFYGPLTPDSNLEVKFGRVAGVGGINNGLHPIREMNDKKPMLPAKPSSQLWHLKKFWIESRRLPIMCVLVLI
jgi:hypothetical protein